METCRLNNGVDMPTIGFGTYKLTESKVCEDSVICAINAGYRMIDTAQVYRNEEYIGNAISKCNLKREDIFITTKVWFTNYDNKKTYNSVIQSMNKLKVDYLDLVLIHWPFGNYYAAWKDLERLYIEGKVKAIGVSNFEPGRLVDLCVFNNITPAVNQVEANVFCQQKNARFWMDKYNINYVAYAPLGQGKINEIYTLPEIINISKKYNRTPAQVMLRFLNQKGFVIIPRSVNKEHILENISIFDFMLTKEELEILDSLDKAIPIIGKSEEPANIESSPKWFEI